MSRSGAGSQPRILVTGASGFLGAHVVARAVSRGLRAAAGVRPSSDLARLNMLAPGCERVCVDLSGGSEEMERAIDGFDAVVHCAAYGVDYRQSDLPAALAVNVVGSVGLLRAVGRRRMIHVGTSYEYGAGTADIAEDTCLAPRGIYGVSKAAATLALLDVAHNLQAEFAVLRPFTMYGPLEGTHKFLPTAMRAALTGEAVDLSPGWQERDYVFVADVADCCIDLALSDKFPNGQILNLCSGVGISLRAFAEAAAIAAAGRGDSFRWGARPYRPNEPMRVVGDPRKAAAILGWRAETQLAAGMAETARWERVRMDAAATR